MRWNSTQIYNGNFHFENSFEGSHRRGVPFERKFEHAWFLPARTGQELEAFLSLRFANQVTET